MQVRPPQPTAPWTRHESLVAAIGALALTVVLVAGTWWRGALGVARNDDPAFYRVAFRLAEELRFDPSDGTRMFFTGQAVLSAPVIWIAGPRPAALQVAVAGLGALGLVVSYRLVRMFLEPRHALIAVAALALGPLYPQLAVTFMTDVPAFTISCVALILGIRAVESGSSRVFAAALTTAFAAFTIREYAVAAGIAIIVAAIVATRRSWSWLPAAAAGWFVSVIAAYIWRSGLTDSLDNQLTLSIGALKDGFGNAATAIMSLSLFVAPAALAVAYPLVRSASRRRIMTAVGIAAIVVLAAGANRRFFAGNYFSRKGPGGTFILGPSPDILDGPLLAAAGLVAATSLIVCVLGLPRIIEMIGSARPDGDVLPGPSDPWNERRVAVFTTASFVAISLGLTVGVPIVSDAPVFDRNLIAMVPFAGALLMLAGISRASPPSPLISRIGWTVLAVLAVVSFQLFDASNVKDGEAWELADTLVADGIPADQIIGGAWTGFHQADSSDGRPPPVPCVDLRWHGTNPGAAQRAIARSMTTTLFGDEIELEAIRRASAC